MATSIAKAVIGSNASKKAASQQAAANEAAANEQRSQFEQSSDNLNAASDKAIKYLQDQYAQTQGMLNPFIGTGTNANQQIAYLLGLGGTDTAAGALGGAGSLGKSFTLQDFEQDPSYKFRLEEGQKALARAQSAGGNYFSGAALKSLSDYNQKAASQEYQSAYDRYVNNQNNLYNKLGGLSNTGLSAANSLAGYGSNNAASLANTTYGTAKDIADLGADKAGAVGNALVGAGNARAQGTLGSGQAWITGINDIENKAARLAGGFAGGGFA